MEYRKQFVLDFNTQKGFGDVSLKLNNGTCVDTSDGAQWGTEASSAIADGFTKTETLPDGRVVTITVAIAA